MASAIPREVNLSSNKPPATPAYTRRFSSLPTNGSTFRAGQNIRITLDTSTPGSFFDPMSSYLQFDFRVGVSNFNSDSGITSLTTNQKITDLGTPEKTQAGEYCRLPRCGAQAFIEEFRIYVQGVPIEEIVSYNVLSELLHDIHGTPTTCDFSATERYLANGTDATTYKLGKIVDMGDGKQDGKTESNQLPRIGWQDIVDVQELHMGVNRYYRVQVPLLSGILGSMAEKMFPAMLVAPGSMYIDIKLAAASTVFVSAHSSEQGANYYPAMTSVRPAWSANHYIPADTSATPPVPAYYNTKAIGTTYTGTDDILYEVVNVQYVCKQVVLMDTVTSAIVSKAAAGDISIHTNSFRSYSTDMGSVGGTANTSVTLLVPAKVASANALYVTFRDSLQLQNAKYESLKRQSIGLSQTGDRASVQLRIGNELIPQSPIVSSSEALIELLKAHHDYPNTLNFTKLGENVRVMETEPYKFGAGANDETKAGDVIRTPISFDDFNCNSIQFPLTGTVTEYHRKGISIDWPNYMYEPAWYSSFALGFDLDTFSYDSNVMRSGRYLGNNTMQLMITNGMFPNVDLSNTSRNWRVDYFVMHDVRVSFQAGGIVQSFY